MGDNPNRGGTGAWSLIRSLLPFLRPYRFRFALLLCWLALQSAASVVLPFIVLKYSVDRILPRIVEERDFRTLALVVGAYLGLQVVAAGLYFLNRYLIFTVGAGIMQDVRGALFRRLQELDLAFYNRWKRGEIISRVMNDVGGIQSLLTSTFLSVFGQALVLVGALALILWTNWRLSLYAMVVVPGLIGITRFFGARLRAVAKKVQAQVAKVTTWLEESLGGIRLVKSFGQEARRTLGFGQELNELRRLTIRAGMLGTSHEQLLGFVFNVGALAVFGLGFREVVLGRMTWGSLVGFFYVMMRFYGPVSAFATINVQIQTALASVDRVMEVLHQRVHVADRPDSAEIATLESGVRFETVTFGYEPGQPILRDFSLTIPKGKTVALFGPSGAGKSTLINLLFRFYDPWEGSVLVDGRDLRDLKVQSLRRLISYVDQDVFLFHTTIEENVRFSRPDASSHDVVEACRMANIHDFVGGLPDGYDTTVGDRGVRLSGGEKQRLSIARAILRDSPVLVLDEATSSLDAESEGLIRAALDHLRRGRTAVVIAHRLSTIQAADIIAVMENGTLIDVGSYSELLERCERFREFHRLQFLMT
jgi:ABC-type multidrug transport system fused ATPase/permease subunit